VDRRFLLIGPFRRTLDYPVGYASRRGRLIVAHYARTGGAQSIVRFRTLIVERFEDRRIVSLPPAQPPPWGRLRFEDPPGDRKLAAMVASSEYAPTVLVVEDEWLLRDFIAITLEDAGLRVVAVGSGEQALVLLNHHAEPIDLAFTDIHLAGKVDGWEVGNACRQRLRVLYTSGVATPPPELKDRFVAKPYHVDAVVQACRALLTMRSRPPAE
jgi:two-component system, response regulator PdtaR